MLQQRRGVAQLRGQCLDGQVPKQAGRVVRVQRLNLEYPLSLQFERVARGAQHTQLLSGEKLGDERAGAGQRTGGVVVDAVQNQ
eukprot:scaffold16982_cov94-Isochrysis_galbana.AAC.2